ncbi:Fc receptor-like protein 5 [Rhinoderma darwinii]|uniref:Fc receptor-like protein 5 n=1 Tax=Rhinoderma darwinii TaxID=43563 RepID=UPI003F67AFE7
MSHKGDEMTLTCDTTLALRRSATYLQFAFYINQQEVKNLSPFDKYSVPSAQLEHSGNYSCEVRTSLNTVRKTSDILHVQVQELFKTPVLQVFPSATVSKGAQVRLQCITASPEGSHLLYSFFKDSQTIRDYDMDNTYLIRQAGDDHSGNYQCSSKPANKMFSKYSNDMDVVVKMGQPRFMLVPDKVVVGDEIILRCESSEGLLPIHYRFYHNGAIIRNVTVFHKRTAEIRQIIKSVTMTGPYYCDSRNDIFSTIQLSGTVILFIMDPVENILITTENDDEDFVFGEAVTFTCSIQRGTAPSFLWFHNKKVIEQGSMFYQLKDNQKHLHIDSIQLNHRGTYQCEASNKISPNRTFSVLSAPRNINVLEPSPAEINVLLIVLGIIVLTILTAVLGFMYRENVALLFRSCNFQQLKTERTTGQARITQNPTNDVTESSLDVGQEDYYNVPSRGHVVCEDVCYAHIDINHINEALIMENSGESLRYMVTCTPNWNHIYIGDSVTLKCNIGPTENINNYNFYWYKDEKYPRQQKQEFTISGAKLSDAGDYECRTRSGDRSYLFSLYVIDKDYHKVILQTPPNILEGDSLDLRCHSSPGDNDEEEEEATKFFKDGVIVQESKHILHLQNVTKATTGIYRCEKFYTRKVLKAEETFIFIQDLFTSPEIKAPYLIKEGDVLTLSCDTRRNPLRHGTPLEFTFYRNGQIVQEFRSSDSYTVQSAQLEDSGNYICEVRTPLDTVRKMSDVSYISIRVAVVKPNLMLLPNTVAVGDDTVLRCESLKGSLPIYYLFYHNQTILGNITVHQNEAAELNRKIKSLSMGGLYYCASYNDFHTQHQHSEEANLLVMEPVADINITLDTGGEDFILGASLTFTCSVQHGTSVSFFWQHNKTVAKQSSELYQLQDDGKVLYIQSLRHHHKGSYQCNASNKLSVLRTFSVLSEIRNVNILELSAVDHRIQWSMLGILLLAIIIAVGLLLTYRDKIVSLGRCKKKPPTTGLNTEQNNEDVDKQNTTAVSEGIYENIPSTENLDDEDESCTYITVRAVKAPSACTAAATRENFTVMYSMAKCAENTSRTKTDQKTPETSDSTDVYQNITADSIDDH